MKQLVDVNEGDAHMKISHESVAYPEVKIMGGWHIVFV